MQKPVWLEITGWTGGIVLMTGYALNSYGVLASSSMLYQVINLLASLILAYYTYRKKAFPNVALNLVWMLIAVIAIFNILRHA